MKSDGTVAMWASTDDGAIYLPSYVPVGLSGISAIAANGYQFAVIIDAPVALRATSSGNDLILAWPTSAVGFTLQSTFSLSPPVAWIDSPHQAVAIGNRFTVTNVLSGSPQFFRLRKQQ